MTQQPYSEKEVLADKIWGYDSDAEYNSVEVYISFLRKKIRECDISKLNYALDIIK